MIYILIITTTIYLTLIVSFCLVYHKVETFENTVETSRTQFSIVIPFRNEAQHLPELLHSISELDYQNDQFEIILIDDDSSDHSRALIDTFIQAIKGKISITLINNIRTTNSPKKDAISLAITHAKYNWIVTTDADCIVPKQWLITLDAFIQTNQPKLVVAPIAYTKISSFLDTFQALDILSLQTATVSGFGLNKPFLCNGANLAYTKQVFQDVEGFKGNDTISSGDDIFLLEKVLTRAKNAVYYLKSKDVIIKTYPEPSLKTLCNQRVRWAAKASSYNNTFGKIVGLIVLIMNAILVIGFILSCFGLFSYKYLVIAFLLKSTVDLWCIYKSASFFNQTKLLVGFIVSSFWYPIFSVFVAVYSNFFKHTWKQRSFRK